MTLCNCSAEPSLTEQMIMRPDALPQKLRDWRCYRIEYGFECSCPEGLIYLPPSVDPDEIEKLLRNAVDVTKKVDKAVLAPIESTATK